MLAGVGGAFGIKFKPGGFYPFMRQSIATIADSRLSLDKVFGDAAVPFELALLAHSEDAPMIQAAIDFLWSRWPAHDPKVSVVSGIVEGIVSDRSITQVEHLVMKHDMGKRSLQRLFEQYVGVSPKWVINRYRLHDAVELLAQRRTIDWTEVALSLGYFDQAHFIRDFKKLVGRSPTEYVRDEGPEL